MSPSKESAAAGLVEYVTMRLDEQLFGLPIARVQDVFAPERLARVPLAPPEIAGVLNLRGRIVTVIDMRRRLGLPEREDGAPAIVVGVEQRGESYGLLVDAVGEVLKLAQGTCEANPVNLDVSFAWVSIGVHRLDEQLLIVLDVDRLLDPSLAALAA